MAKTSDENPGPAEVGRQAPNGAWTPEQLLSAFRDRSDAKRVEALRLAGIIDADGKVTQLYKSWGSKVTRTPEDEVSNSDTSRKE